VDSDFAEARAAGLPLLRFEVPWRMQILSMESMKVLSHWKNLDVPSGYVKIAIEHGHL